MSYDEKCYWLAEYFLQDFVIADGVSAEPAKRIAQEIQDAIESELEIMEDGGTIRPLK